MGSLWDKAKKFYNVATKQGLGNAYSLATKGWIPRGDMNTHSANLTKFEETNQAWKDVTDWLAAGGSDDSNPNRLPGYTDKEISEIHANRFSAHGEYEVWDDDVFVWRNVTPDERSRDAPIKDMSMMTPTRPGSYAYQYEGINPQYDKDEAYRSLKEFDDQSPPQLQNVQGNWLTPDPNDPSGAGLVFTDEKQPTSIDQFKRIWGKGDEVEGNFTNEGLYNLLFEDDKGDVSIVKALDQLNYMSNNGITNEAVVRAIKDLNPQSIYYMDAGMNQDFFYDSYLPESMWGTLQGPGIQEGYFPYTHTGGMVGKQIKGRGN